MSIVAEADMNINRAFSTTLGIWFGVIDVSNRNERCDWQRFLLESRIDLDPSFCRKCSSGDSTWESDFALYRCYLAGIAHARVWV